MLLDVFLSQFFSLYDVGAAETSEAVTFRSMIWLTLAKKIVKFLSKNLHSFSSKKSIFFIS